MNYPKVVFPECASHLSKAFGNREAHQAYAAEQLKTVDFDTIVVTGISGMVFGSVLSFLMKKHLVVVRKGGDRCHSFRKVETSFVERDGHLSKVSFRWVFLDDLVDSGKTFKRVRRKVKEMLPGGVYVGRYMFDTHNFVSVKEDGRFAKLGA
jgi:adenine/guanine phosphoribosyltransferase-like PRPP-binding protein